LLENYWAMMGLIYAVIPSLDQLMAPDWENLSEIEEEQRWKEIKWDMPLYMFMVLETISTFWGIWHVGRNTLSVAGFVGFVLMLG
jgi:hypothetical protein